MKESKFCVKTKSCVELQEDDDTLTNFENKFYSDLSKLICKKIDFSDKRKKNFTEKISIVANCLLHSFYNLQNDVLARYNVEQFAEINKDIDRMRELLVEDYEKEQIKIDKRKRRIAKNKR